MISILTPVLKQLYFPTTTSLKSCQPLGKMTKPGKDHSFEFMSKSFNAVEMNHLDYNPISKSNHLKDSLVLFFSNHDSPWLYPSDPVGRNDRRGWFKK